MVTLQVLQAALGCTVHYALHQSGKSAVIFFPGDRLQGQDLPAQLARLQDPQHIAQLLLAKFLAPHIFIVMPSRYENSCFACYGQLLNKTTASGEPLGYQGNTFKATQQLSSLLLVAMGGNGEPPFRLPVHLVGFSKGGTVLNQVLAEVAAAQQHIAGLDTRRQPEGRLPMLLSALQQVHYVDVGLNSRGAYLTDPEAVQQLGAWCREHPRLEIFLHGTPRQWDDARRPWIAIEKNRLLAMCSAAGVPTHECKYYKGCRGSLEMHFQILEDLQVPCRD